MPHTFEPVGYRAHLSIEERRFAGAIEITGDLSEPTAILWLHGVDLDITHATATHGGEIVPLEFTRPRTDQLIGLQAGAPLAVGRWTLSITYSGPIHEQQPTTTTVYGPSEPAAVGAFRRIVDGETYVYTQSEPIYARAIFPCIDEPDRKVPWQLTLDVANHVQAFSNAPVAHESALDHEHKRVEFAPTLPLPSYLVAFAVGNFDVVDAGTAKHGTPIRIVVPHGTGKDVAWSTEPARRIVNLLEDWFEIPYPYPKLDLVAVPHAGWGAMENPGLITFDEPLFHPDGKDEATRSEQRESWVGVASHELAHQWFGDLVTPRWWDDLWLSETLATWMASKLPAKLDVIAQRDPVEESAMALLTLSARHTPIRKTVPDSGALTFEHLMRGYDYSGGALVLELFEAYLGPVAFRRGIQMYLQQHAHGNGASTDFSAAMTKVTGRDVDAAFAGFLDDGGAPTVDFELKCERNQASLDLSLASDPRTRTLPICFAYDRDGAREDTCVVLGGASLQVPLAGRSCPAWLAPSVGGVSLYRPFLSQASSEALLVRGWGSLSSDERRAMFGQLGNESLEVAALPKLLATTDGKSVLLGARSLLRLRETVPDKLRGTLDQWILKTFTARARSLRLVKIPSADADSAETDLVIAELLASAGERTLVSEAVKLTVHYQDLPTALRRVVLRIASHADPKVVRRLLADLKTIAPSRRYETLEALAHAPATLGALKNDPSSVESLDDWERLKLIMAPCDLTVAPEAVTLVLAATKTEAETPAARWAASCAERKKRVEPAFRAWLAPLVPHLPQSR